MRYMTSNTFEGLDSRHVRWERLTGSFDSCFSCVANALFLVCSRFVCTNVKINTTHWRCYLRFKSHREQSFCITRLFPKNIWRWGLNLGRVCPKLSKASIFRRADQMTTIDNALVLRTAQLSLHVSFVLFGPCLTELPDIKLYTFCIPESSSTPLHNVLYVVYVIRCRRIYMPVTALVMCIWNTS